MFESRNQLILGLSFAQMRVLTEKFKYVSQANNTTNKPEIGKACYTNDRHKHLISNTSQAIGTST